jgi:hypothetical protein
VSDTGRSMADRQSQSHRATGGRQRLSGSGPIQSPTRTGQLAKRLRALLLVVAIVGLSVGVWLVARSSDGDDDAQAPAGKSQPGDAQPGSGVRVSTAPPRTAARAPQAAPVELPPASAPPAAARIASAAGPAAAAPASDAPSRGHARDAGTVSVAEARRAAAPPAGKSKSTAADAAHASRAEAEGKPAQAPDGGVPPAPPRRESADRHERENDAGQIRVARFVEAGGVDLMGRVINADTGRPVPGISVEARLEGRFVEVETEGDGSFRAPGMVPGSKTVVWIGGRRDRMVAERFDIRIPDGGKKTAELGLVRLLPGDELEADLDGWIGIYVARKDDRVRVSAVNAWVPATRAGIEVGDAVLSVNGRDVKWLGPRSVAYLLRGPIGSSMTMEVESATGAKRRTLKLTRVTR